MAVSNQKSTFVQQQGSNKPLFSVDGIFYSLYFGLLVEPLWFDTAASSMQHGLSFVRGRRRRIKDFEGGRKNYHSCRYIA
jgi:hypothetical protein